LTKKDGIHVNFKKFKISIRESDVGIVIDVWPVEETDDAAPLASTWVLNSQLPEGEHFLRQLAPYVKPSVDGEIPYIEWQGEELDFWRQEFIDGNMITKTGEFVWRSR
jgi:hypothetical protein